MARRRNSNRRRRGSFSFLYKVLSVLVICGAITAALTLFFKVNHIFVSGQQRYTEEEILEASGIKQGDNLFLLNKYSAASSIAEQLPYINIEDIWIRRKLPDTLMIDVKECSAVLAVIQDDFAWLISPSGQIVEQKAADAQLGCGTIDGIELLAPSVGTKIALATELAEKQDCLLRFMGALEDRGMLRSVDAIHMGDPAELSMDYLGRFTVKINANADYDRKLRTLEMILESEAIQDNMTGTFDMRQENGEVHLIQDRH